MSVKIRLVIELDDEWADPQHSTGMNDVGYEQIMNDIGNKYGTIVEGPELVTD